MKSIGIILKFKKKYIYYTITIKLIDTDIKVTNSTVLIELTQCYL